MKTKFINTTFLFTLQKIKTRQKKKIKDKIIMKWTFGFLFLFLFLFFCKFHNESKTNNLKYIYIYKKRINSN